jgi:poly(3-hydroxybutyrate) depolymerase
VLRTLWIVPAIAWLLAGQTYAPGPQVRVFISDVDGNAQPYGLYLPRDFDASRSYPLVISLHSEGSNHRLDLRRVFGLGNLFRQTDAEAANGPFPPFPNVDFIVACPLARGTMGYQGIAEKDVYDVLSDVEKRFPIDPDRLYLTGSSMGGGGALWLALTRPGVWAAVAAVCPEVPPGTDQLAPNAFNLPVRIFQGEQDPVVPAESSRRWRTRLQEAGARVEYTEYRLVRHNAWDHAYRGGAVFAWFAQFKRDRFPRQVRFVTSSYKYSSSYWVQLDGLTPGEAAWIDARFTDPNRLLIETRHVDGFSLSLAGHPMYDARRPVVLEVDGGQLEAGPHADLSFSRTEKGWAVTRYARPPDAKGPGQEGPIREALARRHLYVYGTADSPDDNELARRRAQAERAADWSEPPYPLLLTLRAVADKEVTEADLAGADLVLFGTRQTNSLIARFGSRLPMELNPSAADYGMVVIAPAGDRYILVNSGLAWWSGLDTASKTGTPSPPAYKALLDLGDYVVFRRSLANVVAAGRFDQNWKLPAGQAAKLAAAGVVQIR